MLTEDILIANHMPDGMKTAIAEYRTHELVSPLLGTSDVTFDKVAAYLGQRLAERRASWQTIGAGLEALINVTQR